MIKDSSCLTLILIDGSGGTLSSSLEAGCPNAISWVLGGLHLLLQTMYHSSVPRTSTKIETSALTNLGNSNMYSSLRTSAGPLEMFNLRLEVFIFFRKSYIPCLNSPLLLYVESQETASEISLNDSLGQDVNSGLKMSGYVPSILVVWIT